MRLLLLPAPMRRDACRTRARPHLQRCQAQCPGLLSSHCIAHAPTPPPVASPLSSVANSTGRELPVGVLWPGSCVTCVAVLDGGLVPRRPLHGYGLRAACFPGSHVRCPRWVLANRTLPAMRCFSSPPLPTLIDSTAHGHLWV